MGARSVTIEPRYHGLPGLAYGGYVAGLTASALDGPTKVDFRAPAPFDTPLRIEVDGDGARLVDDGVGDDVVAVASSYEPTAPPPALPTWSDAHAATQRFEADTSLEFPECFGCGPGRADGEGLRVFVGPVPGQALVAGVWTPDAALADDDGVVRRELVWASLDCPGGWARRHFLGVPEPGVTAYLAAHLTAPVRAGEPHLVVGWPIRREGRKAWVGVLVVGADGAPCAVAEALWLDRRTPTA